MASLRVVYTFDDMIASLRNAVKKFPDIRTGRNIQYELMDAASGAFSVFFTQCPSFLSHQELMQQKYGLSNAKTLFGIKDIPCDNQIRTLLDTVNPQLLSGVFTSCFTALKTSGHLTDYRVALGEDKNDLLIALDGTQYFSSESIHCNKCSQKVKDGKRHYSHTMVTPTIVAPGNNKVVSLYPSFITPQDGDKKQDCELKASKRWLKRDGKDYAKEGITILGDDLYAHEPFCRDLLSAGMNFILVCKPESHKITYEWVKGVTREYRQDRFDGKTHQIYTYNYVENVPLRDGADSLLVNFIEVVVTDRKTGKQRYHNVFVTNHSLTQETLPVLIDCGRARWKIENENNNTLKTKGYHLEHNFGHGTNYLACILATMNLLAFLFHTVLGFMNKKYQLLRKGIGTRARFFDHMKILLIYHCFKSFDNLMTFMEEGLKKPHDVTKLHYPL